MNGRWRTGEPLASAQAGGPLLAAWLGGGNAAYATPAAGDLTTALAASAPTGGAPLFTGVDGAVWRRSRQTAAGPAGDDGFGPERLTALAAGGVALVVTGQQPGFLGGPLLTLHKIATAVALANRLTAAGRPALAVFWCGDDDDDLPEALTPLGWSPDGTSVVAGGRAAARRGRLGRTMIGPTSVRHWCAPGASLLAGLAAARSGDVAPAALAELWTRALAEDWNWSDLNVAAVRLVFGDAPLVVVRGNDPGLHEAARPLYERIAAARERCVAGARARGVELAAIGGVPPIAERSLRHHLFAAIDGRREVVPDGTRLPDPATLRPGVLLRSAVQDWLLRPAAVVVGPGEAAYLAQLRPVYEALQVPRSPLVPRLFAWVLQPGFEAASLAALRSTPVPASIATGALAASLAAPTALALAAALERELGLPAARAGALATGRARRWERGVAALLRGELARHRQQAAAALPGWVAPDGHRQERRLAAMAAVGLFGDRLVPALLGAAEAHLVAGADGRWHEYLVE